MKKFTETLYREMTEAMRQASMDSDSLLSKAEKSYRIAESSILRLRDFVSDYTFEDKPEEIHFFKSVKPRFHKELIYWAEILHIEANRPIPKSREHKRYNNRLLEGIDQFLKRNRYLQTYYKLYRTDEDELLFLRDTDYGPFLPDGHIDADRIFSTTASSALARILAMQEVAQWLISEQSNSGQQPKHSQARKLTWTGSKAQLIELVYALESYGIFNNGKTNVKEIMEYFQQCFNVDKVSNYYGYFQNMRIRKKDRTPFLNGLVEHTIRRMDESDEFPRFS
ncbi:hypothetical protein FXV77_05285 [Sphingobacterium phlebotomi]|uniref:RteC protein n=1 Tax=Sphingobacterium phlebotomi TaxID=2605433 RepID=A0A5D4H9W0_9SPHI|nr:RteC domain-containing protein [Sphingobacterium phlebotomi]TYR37418.1 hypothetical protein FXV77_05285 [Sphingobacterium phlebotomi]